MAGGPAWGVEAAVIDVVVVALGQHVHGPVVPAPARRPRRSAAGAGPAARAIPMCVRETAWRCVGAMERVACAAVLRVFMRSVLVRALMRSRSSSSRQAAGLVRAALFVDFDDAMNDGYVPAFDLEDDDLSHAKRAASQPEEKDVPSLKCWLHAPTGI
jgi:hypothetical protein